MRILVSRIPRTKARLHVLADLVLESEAATLLMMRLAFDEASADESQRSIARIATAVAKYWICKRAPELVVEPMESHGGAGYVEESILPRLFRESPLNSIWEGSGNVICSTWCGRFPESRNRWRHLLLS